MSRYRPPLELTRYAPRDWIPAGAESHPNAPRLGHAAWCAARADWVAQGGVWPGGNDARLMLEMMLTPGE